MHKKSVLFWLSMLLVTLVALSGCSARPGAGQTAAAAGNEGVAVDLPAIELTFDEEGKASFGGMPITQLGSSLGVDGLDAVAIPTDMIGMLKAANIQHLQVNNTAEGLIILVNGEAIPSIGLDGGAAVGLADVAKLLGFDRPGLEKLLPTINSLGIGIVARFPMADGASEIPVEVTGDSTSAAKVKAATDEFINKVGNAGVINIPVYYADDGSWTVAGMTDTEWANLTGDSMFQSYRLKPEIVAGFKARGIKELTISTDAKGLHIGINGQPLPYITWSDGKLNHLVNVLGQMGLLSGAGTDASQLNALIDQWLPLVAASNVNLRVFFQ